MTTHAPALRFPPFASIALLAFASFALAPRAAAQDDRWHWRLTPYAWATDVGVNVRLGERQIVNETIPVKDLVEDVDVSLQGRLEGRCGAHGFFVDVFYVRMSDDASFALPQGAGTGAIDWHMDLTLADIAATYHLGGDDGGFTFLYGTRVLDQRASAATTFTTPSGTQSKDFDPADTLVDALAGVRFGTTLLPRLRLQSELTFSTGGTNYTWSAFSSLSYALGERGPELLLGYRHMEIDFKASADIDADLTLTGPLLGMRFLF